MSQFLEKVVVVLKAVPTWGAAATSALTGVSAAVVPVLPVSVGVKVAAVFAAALGAVAAVVKTVARVTPIAESQVPSLIEETKADWEGVF
jgi:predicted polyphosphate/ATP-dependent NAD kinase